MPDRDIPTRLTQGAGRLMFAARWVMAPIYIGLLVGLILLAAKFVQTVVALVPALWTLSASGTVLAVLSLVDLSLVANLVLIVTLAGWQGFLDPLIDPRGSNQPAWLALDFSAIKLKLIGSIATIGAVEMLESMMHADSVSEGTVVWELEILLSLGVLGVMLALMDRLSHKGAKE
jgi:uncharacterized protein (TIGR00645 family)